MSTRAQKQLRNSTRDDAAASALAASPPLRVGATVAYSYRVVRELSAGGMSQLYVVEHLPSTSYAALKVALRASGEGCEVLGRERTLLARVKHPNVVRVFDHGRLLDGRQYLVLELIPGADLAAWLGTYGKLTPSHALSVLWQLAVAVDHLHAKGVVHSDIKPSNIMLNVLDRHVTLIDFGVAFDFATEQAQRGNSGTRGYIAPEQERGEGCGPATDRFAVAAVAQELLGLSFASRARKRQPARGAFAAAGAATHSAARDIDKAPSNVALRSVFRRALHARPEDRYASARGFVKALARALNIEAPALPERSDRNQRQAERQQRAERVIAQSLPAYGHGHAHAQANVNAASSTAKKIAKRR